MLLLATWLKKAPPFSERKWDVIELFAGTARIGRLAAAAGWFALVHDMSYDRTGRPNNSMNLNTSAGFMIHGRIQSIQLSACMDLGTHIYIYGSLPNPAKARDLDDHVLSPSCCGVGSGVFILRFPELRHHAEITVYAYGKHWLQECL